MAINYLLALMKLSRPVKLVGRSRIRAVCLPTKRLTHNQTDLCIATGWGRDSEDGPLAGRLLEAKVPVHDNAVCRKKYQHAVAIRSGHLCAGHLDGSSGTCVVRKAEKMQLLIFLSAFFRVILAVLYNVLLGMENGFLLESHRLVQVVQNPVFLMYIPDCRIIYLGLKQRFVHDI